MSPWTVVTSLSRNHETVWTQSEENFPRLVDGTRDQNARLCVSTLPKGEIALQQW